MKLLNKLGTSLDRIIDFAAVFSGALIVILMVSTVANVSGRYFGYPIIGMEEVSEYFLLWLTFSGAAWVLRMGKHVRIDVISNFLPPKAKIVLLNIVLSIIAAVIFLFIAYYGAASCWDYIQRGVYLPQILRPLKGVVYAIIPAGSLLLSIQSLRDVYNGFKSFRRR